MPLIKHRSLPNGMEVSQNLRDEKKIGGRAKNGHDLVIQVPEGCGLQRPS